MTEDYQEIEVSGQDVDEAIDSGLNQLGVPRNQVEIEVLDEGRRGLLGIGGREALVRLRIIAAPKPAPAPTRPKPVPRPPTEVEPLETAKPPAVMLDDEQESETRTEVQSPSATEIETAIAVVKGLLQHMAIDAAVSSRLSEPDDLTGRRLAILDIEGDDLSVLIGPRGETLDALQYVSRLMVGHRLQQRAHFVIDVDGYRDRREQALSRLAERMAGKAVKRGSPITLEAMPAHERRIIHMALRDSPDVTTESTGEGKRRRVRIYPT
jgi:spoIIIJ-associated protein